MEILEHELMDEQDAKEVAHDLPESVSVLDLKTVLPADFCDQVHLAVGAQGFLSEHEWRSGPVLLVRFIMGPEESAQVQLGENVNRNALDVARELDEAVKGVLPAEHKDNLQVWHRPPSLDRWNEQWVFETLVGASEKVLEESVAESVLPSGLSEDAASAWQVIVNVLKQENALPSSGEKIIYVPEEWEQREGERLGAELIVLHENGNHCPYFNLNYQGHLLHAKMDLALRDAGFRMESQTNWYSAIYKALPDDEQINRVAQWSAQQKQIAESDEDDFGDEDRDVFEPGGSRVERIQYLFTNAGLHIVEMVEIPADPNWGDLGQPKRTIDTVLQPDQARPWTLRGDPKMPEFLDFLTRMMSNLGEILETTDVDYTTKFDQELSAWKIKWFVGEPEIDRHKLRESDDEDMDDAKEVGNIPPPRARMPSGLEGWQDYLQNVYSNFEEFQYYDELRGLAGRLGFESPEEAWAANPLIRGSVNPEDFGLVESIRSKLRENENEDEFAWEDQDNAQDVWRHDTPAVNITHMFKLIFDFGAGEGRRELVFAVPADLLPPVGPNGDTTEIENFVRQYARQALAKQVPRDDWDWLVDVEPANPERLVSELGEDLAAEVVDAAKEADKNPSDEQKEAGNYQKGHVILQDLDISIENAKGSMRRGKDKGGKEWEVKLPAHYGYIKGTEGKDKDHIDVFIGENPESEKVYVVNQNKMEGGFDEHKVMLGFDDRDEAIQHYDDAYSDGLGKKLRGSVVSTTTMEKFKAWLKGGEHKKEFEEVKLAESLIDEVFAYLESIKPKLEQAKLAAAEKESDPDIKESILQGHGSYVGICGHRIKGCRCSSQLHPGKIQVEAVCRECSKVSVQESVDVTREALQTFLDGITSSEVYNEEEGFHHLPDGTPTGTCTRTAELVAKEFGGRVLGYYHDDNSTAKLGDSEGGHDFTMIGNRWLVDWWAKNVTGQTSQEVFDFHDPNDAKLIAELYGEPTKWKPLEAMSEGVTGFHASPNKFKTFDTSKEGAHFGTQEQAANVGKAGLRKPIAYSLDIKNPLRLRDIGVWNNFNNLHGALSIGDHITQEQADAVWAAWLRSDAEGWDALKVALEQNGYDGIVYQNELEGPGDSYIALRAGQIHRLKESTSADGVELKLTDVMIVNRKAVPFLKEESEEDFDEPGFNEVAPEHEWEPRERPANNWAFFNKETEVGLSIRNDGGGNYYFSLAIPGSVFNVVTSQYATDDEAVKRGLEWANNDPIFRSRLNQSRQ